MPRGDNPNSRANLKPNTKANRTKEEQRELARKAGKASGEARRASASLTESLRNQLTPDLMDEITLTLIKRAKQGNLKAYELLRDQMGEKPSEKIVVAEVDAKAIDDVEMLIDECLGTEKKDD